MNFIKKLWKDRQTDFPSRRTITYEDGSTALVRLTRTEGKISEEGDAFNATNMNDLEERVANADAQTTSTIQAIIQNSSDANKAFSKAINDIEHTLKNLFSTAEGINYVKSVLPHTTYLLNIEFPSAEKGYAPVALIDARCDTPGIVIGSMVLYNTNNGFGYEVLITNTTDFTYEYTNIMLRVLLANWRE